jgi:hypothetical protein
MNIFEVLEGGTILIRGARIVGNSILLLSLLFWGLFFDIVRVIQTYIGIYTILLIINTILFVKWKRKLIKNL